MSNSKKNSVLIVDDEKSNIEVLIHILSGEYSVSMTRSGASAIEIAKEYLPDIILLDILMPDMNGYDVLAALKASEKTRNIPVIFITGLDSIEDEEKGLGLEAADFIHKPFSAEIVKSRVRNQIQIVNQIRELVELHKDLETAVASAENANRSKSAFLARMSHEIRTPMNAILGISEIQLQKENLLPDIKEAFTRIFNSGDLLLGIINDILDMSKIEAGKLELIPGKYDVASLISDTVFLNMIKFENKPIEFILNIDENVPSMLFGDELRVKQILNNLLSNAFKYTATGKVELSVSADGTKDITLVIRVCDTGQGMTKEQMDMLFDEYTRFNPDVNRTTEGTGLGMNIVHNLIRMMNGQIFAESETGKGSLFTVRLPQGNTGALPLGKEITEKLKQFRSSYEVKIKKSFIVPEKMPSAKVLIVDDMDMNLYVVKGMLAPYGLQMDTALSGMEAIEKIKHNTYDLVFMDHMMPKMDGVETVKEIRKLKGEFEKLPIIALTANAVAGMKEMFLANGFNGFISKPIIMRELDEILKEWLSHKKAAYTSADNDVSDNGGFDEKFFDSIRTIEDINVEIGIERFSDNLDIYRNSLNILYKNMIPECNKLTSFLEKKDMEGFMISVHSMKTSLAIVGAMKLSETAFQLETASKVPDIEFCQSHFPAFKEKLLLIHEKLSYIFRGGKAAQEKQPGNGDFLRESVKIALAAADEFDNDTGMEITGKLLKFDYGNEIYNLLESALSAFENFEYEKAAGFLKRINK